MGFVATIWYNADRRAAGRRVVSHESPKTLMGFVMPKHRNLAPTRRSFLAAGAATVALPAVARAQSADSAVVVTPPDTHRILISPKLSMVPAELKGKKLSLAERFELVAEAGFDGVDLDQAGLYTAEEARRSRAGIGRFRPQRD